MERAPIINPPIYGYVRMERCVLKLESDLKTTREIKTLAEIDIVRDGGRYVLRCCEHATGAPMNDGAPYSEISTHRTVAHARDAMTALMGYYVHQRKSGNFRAVLAYATVDGVNFNPKDRNGEGPWNPLSMVGAFVPRERRLGAALKAGCGVPLFG